jgi:RND family efflux transporter MFP subunit
MRQLCLLTVLLLAACGGEEAERSSDQEEEAVRVIGHEIGYVPDRRVIEAVGTARAKRTAVVRSETAGEVVAVRFEVGDEVEPGQVLLELDPEDQGLEADLARVAVREAEQLLARYRRIEGTGAVSGSAIDEARTALEAAKLEAKRAELALARRTVRAPFAGRVGLTDIDPGARVTPDTAITQLDDRGTLYIDFPVPEEEFSSLRRGTKVEVQAFSERAPRQAEIVALDSRIDLDTRSFTARAALANEDDRLRPGMSFRVSFTSEGRSYPIVPEAAIVWGGDGAYLWVVEDGRAVRRPVAIVSRQEGFVLVDADLAEGSLIVGEGVQKVREGSPVEAGSSPRSPSGGVVAATARGAP